MTTAPYRPLIALALLATGLAACAGGAAHGTPAPCATDADCGGARCLHLHDDQHATEGPGFCEVDERVAAGGHALGAAAPCTTDADCGPSVCLHLHDGDGREAGAFCRTDGVACPRFCATGGGEGGSVCLDDRDCGGGVCGATATCAL
jgi:hypothetical protein